MVQAANVIVRNCRIVGPLTGTPANTLLVYCGSSACANFTLEMWTFKPALVSENTNSIYGHRMTRIRNNICNGGEGSDTYAIAGQSIANVVVQGDYIHDLAYFCPPTSHPDHNSNNDVNQHTAGNGLTYDGYSMHSYWEPTVGNASNSTMLIAGVVDLKDPYTAAHLDANGNPTTLVSGNRNDIITVAGISQKGKLNCNAVFQFNGTTTGDVHMINNRRCGGSTTCNVADTTLAIKSFDFRNNRV